METFLSLLSAIAMVGGISLLTLATIFHRELRSALRSALRDAKAEHSLYDDWRDGR